MKRLKRRRNKLITTRSTLSIESTPTHYGLDPPLQEEARELYNPSRSNLMLIQDSEVDGNAVQTWTYSYNTRLVVPEEIILEMARSLVPFSRFAAIIPANQRSVMERIRRSLGGLTYPIQITARGTNIIFSSDSGIISTQVVDGNTYVISSIVVSTLHRRTILHFDTNTLLSLRNLSDIGRSRMYTVLARNIRRDLLNSSLFSPRYYPIVSSGQRVLSGVFVAQQGRGRHLQKLVRYF